MNLTKWVIGETEGHNGTGLILLDSDRNRIVSLIREEDGRITFHEENEGYFSVTMHKDDAKRTLLEALAWIDNIPTNE